MLIRRLVGIVLGLALVPSACLAACPTNTAEGGNPNFPPVQSSAPIWNGSVTCGTFALDLIAGSAQLSGHGGGGEYSCYSSLSASDLFQIVGPATANPIPLVVHAHLTGNWTASPATYGNMTFCNDASLHYQISSGATANTYRTPSNGPCAGDIFDTEIVLNLSKFPGESFPLAMWLNCQAYGGTGTIRGDISFTGLPQGYSIQSCQGFAGQPVAVVPRSWGNLKHTYR